MAMEYGLNSQIKKLAEQIVCSMITNNDYKEITHREMIEQAIKISKLFHKEFNRIKREANDGWIWNDVYRIN